MATLTFINLPVKDLTRTTEFFTKLGFSFDPMFTDDNATRMIISDEASAMLLVEDFFSGVIAPDKIADTAKTREVIVGLSADTREQVDDLVDTAVAAGAHDLGAEDDGFMYMRGFRDLDGHQWSYIYMDMSAVPES